MFSVLNYKLKVFFTELIKGKYSLEYYNLFKDNGLKNPFIPCFNDEFIFHIIKYLKQNSEIKIFKTEHKIMYGNVPFSIKINDLLKTKNEPDYFTISNFDKFIVKIFGYNDDILNAKMKSLYFFVDDIFILGENVFLEYSLPDNVNIAKIIFEKYSTKLWEDIDDFFIEDVNKNVIYYSNNGFEKSIKYFNVEDEKAKNIYSKLSTIALEKNDISNEIAYKLSKIV